MYNKEQILENEKKYIDKSSRCKWKYFFNGQWVTKSVIESYGLNRWADEYLFGIDPMNRPKCPICGNDLAFDWQNLCYRSSCGNPSCAQTIAMRSQELRDRISTSVKQLYIEHPELKERISSSVSEYYKNNPEAGINHGKIISAMWKDPNSIFNSDQYRSNLGSGISEGLKRAHANPNSGYHDPEVRKRQSEACSRSMSEYVRLHPEFLHSRVFNWIDNLKKSKSPKIFTRSTWEMHWINRLENNPEVLSYEWEPFSLEYYNPDHEGTRYYTPDVLVHYIDHDELQEIKRDDKIYDPIVVYKTKSAIKWCNQNNIIFRFICYREIFYNTITEIDYSRYD